MNADLSELLVALVPFLVALMSLAGGAVIYWWQKKQDRDAELVRVRHQAYRHYLTAQQKVLTAAIRTVNDKRREAVDELCSVEMTLYIVAANNVVVHLSPLHDAFFDYVRAIRCRWEPYQKEKYGGQYSDLKRFEANYTHALNKVVQEMRKDSTGDSVGEAKFDLKVALASQEIVESLPRSHDLP